MDNARAYHQFWNSFGWKAYDENTVPDNALNENAGRHITYSYGTPSNFENTMGLIASLWHRSTAWDIITSKAEEIYQAIGYGGKYIKTDGGYLWIKRGQPFAQRMSDEDDTLRRILLNIEVDFLSE